jgi:hypothetical protein
MVERGEREGLSTEDCKEMATLRREAKRMTMESDLLKRSATFRGGGAGPVFTERGRIRTTIQSEGAPPLWELVGQRFAPRAPDVTWCGDISYFPTGEGWLYPAGVLDLGSRRLLGWVLGETMPTALVSGALSTTTNQRGGQVAGVIFHSEKVRNICRTSSGDSLITAASTSRLDELPRATTMQCPRRSGRASSLSSPTATGSPPEPTPRRPSPHGSSATTPSGSTRCSATYRRSSGRSVTGALNCKLHNHMSAWRGNLRPRRSCSDLRHRRCFTATVEVRDVGIEEGLAALRTQRTRCTSTVTGSTPGY